ncbi:MAG: gliding motility protein GldN [Bacteroidaceae bacterium]|nr:gliding motility protein GldN [Bacteroidaceae bacterium]
MKRFFFIAVSLLLTTSLLAQPAKKRVTPGRAAADQKKEQTAVRKFPSAPKQSDDVTWRRDIYRTLDLKKDANAPLYYPIEPSGKQQNLFTYLFRLLIAGNITAYNYTLDGNENFDAKNKVDVKEFLSRYNIFHEIEKNKIVVQPQDIPSADVTRYYIKESSTFDQRTSTFRRNVVAICPVLMDPNSDDFGIAPKPLFWVKYEDVASYLGRLPVMASNYNNVTNMTANDFFALNRYDGKIYKTNNMQGRVLQNYCKDDSTMNKEQLRIEKELTDFEAGIWTTQKPDTAKVDSTAAAAADNPKAKKKEKASSSSSSRRSKSSSKSSSKSGGKSSSGKSVSARRQRR